MSGGGTQNSLRKYVGAIKDSTKIVSAKVNSYYTELDVAIVKATNHVERPAKEKHIRQIFYAISAARPRADVAYCIHALARRLAKTHNWAVALKTLIIIHRALREVDPTFREELINYGRNRGHMLNMAHFKDDSSPKAWDYSAWVRSYALFLEERLECYRVLAYDIETEPQKLRDLDTVQLLEQLPALQQLLFRVLGCQPQGAAVYNFVIQLALTMVSMESMKIYNAICDGTANLVDKFFEMQRHDAVKAFEIYKRAGEQAEKLSHFYELCRSLDLGRGERYINIEQPPASFLTAMEEYVKDAPRMSTVRKNQVSDNKISAPTVVLALEYKKVPEVQEAEAPNPPLPPPEPVKHEVAPVSEPVDLLGLDEANSTALELDEKNSLALAIVPADNASATTPSGGFSPTSTSTGWELALVTAPSSNESAVVTSKLGGGLDKLTLDSLYDDAQRRQNQNTSYNPWEAGPVAGSFMQPVVNDPFYASNMVAAPSYVQMAAMAQQQQQAFMLQQQSLMMMGNQPPRLQQSANPFGFPHAVGGSHPYGSGMPFHAVNPYNNLV
ncbi:putative clathrin assembly protein [Acorus gramineus]|uniref:Clathrin assembly protein n=1 Tax=Acorus gramineus TaxID=55184 RepID=A0AAV9BGH3_ACOGR|nr:putative clathrin assembly protein [Acorus gramineus]